MQINSQIQHLAGLNDQQREAVLCRHDIVYVSAGPGTGKTHMLTSKLVDFIVSSDTPQKIVALSYTNTAARQIGERFEKKIRQCGITAEYSFFNGTIHSFCYRMMKQFGESSFDYVILDEEEITELAQEIGEHYGGKYPIGQILSCLRYPKKGDALSDEISSLKEAYKVISIQDILTRFIRMMDESAAFRLWIQDKVSVMAIDEAQDLSDLNYAILDRLIDAIPRLKVFLVGDPRQNIFEFNGGSYKHLEVFLNRHPLYTRKDLSITYRCGKAIADYVNGFDFEDCGNVPLQSKSSDTGTVNVNRYSGEPAEAQAVLDSILQTGSISKCAVLSNNLRYLDPLIKLLQEKEIPYKVFGGRKTLKKHIRFLNHILRIIDSDNAYSIRKISEYAGINIMQNGKRKKSLFFASDLGKVITGIREETKELQFPAVLVLVLLRIMRAPDDPEDITKDYDDLMALSGFYESTSDYLMSFSTDKERFAQFYLKDYEECKVPVEDDYLTISTIHSAKGLEWDHVYVMGLCEGNFPNPFFAQGLPPKHQEEFFNAEWKKMYVAATRARVFLHLSYPETIMRKGFSFRKDPSRFIVSLLPRDYAEQRPRNTYSRPYHPAAARPSAR